MLEAAQQLSLPWFQISRFAEIRDCLGLRGDKRVLAQPVVGLDAGSLQADTQVQRPGGSVRTPAGRIVWASVNTSEAAGWEEDKGAESLYLFSHSSGVLGAPGFILC